MSAFKYFRTWRATLMRLRPSTRLVARREQVAAAEQATTSITLGEIAYGARKANRPALYQRAVGLLRGVKILDFDRAAAERYGETRLALESAGVRLADPDLRIAAIAVASDRLLVRARDTPPRSCRRSD